MDKIFKQLSSEVAQFPGLTWLTDENRTISGLGRCDNFEYPTRFPQRSGIRNTVQLEPGVQSGTFPTETRTVSSLVGDFGCQSGAAWDVSDLAGFDMKLMHVRRAFVERMFAIRSQQHPLSNWGFPFGSDGRHYADLAALPVHDEVKCRRASEQYLRNPRGLQRAQPHAPARQLPVVLSGPGRLAFERAHDEQRRTLFADGNYPSLSEVLNRFSSLRCLL